MEALICPECGGRVDPPASGIDYVKCEYCSTSFRIGQPAPESFRPHPAPRFEDTTRPATGKNGWVFIAVVIFGAVIFGFIRLMSVQTKTNETINAAQDTVNSVQSAANAMRQAANTMANAAKQVNVNSTSPSPSPKSGRASGH